MSQIESFATLSLQQPIPSYLYNEYSNDDDLQAFVTSQNSLAQGYLDWFNSTPLGLYTSPNITGSLLDWIGQGVYGVSRPVLTSISTIISAGYNAYAYNSLDYNGLSYTQTGSAAYASDDLYKRVLTWITYRGDGQIFTMGWLKNRISRFLNGANGSDYDVVENPPSITVSGNVFSVEGTGSTTFLALMELYNSGYLPFPFQYTLSFTDYFINDGGVLQLTASTGYPTNPTGLSPGALWDNGGVVSVIPGITPNPSAPPVFFGIATPSAFVSIGGGNLPLSRPAAGSNQLWNNGGVVSIA